MIAYLMAEALVIVLNALVEGDDEKENRNVHLITYSSMHLSLQVSPLVRGS